MSRLIDGYGRWAQNAPPPVPVETCQSVIANLRDQPNPSRDDAKKLVKHLLGKWPWLAKTEQDLRVYYADGVAIFQAFSLAAAKHVLDPVAGPEWERDSPPPGTALRRELAAFDSRRRAAAHAAQWIIDEAERRRAEAERDALIERERAERRAKGLPPLSSVLAATLQDAKK